MQSWAKVKSQIASAYDEGMEKGIETGIEKGIYQTKRETVLLAEKQGLSMKGILKITQLSEEPVQKILTEIQTDGQNTV